MRPLPTTQEVVSRIDELATATASGVPEVEPGSSLARDDADTSPFHLSHAAWTAIVIASDHLIAYRALVVTAQQTQPWAHHTLLRAAIESAVTAVWLLAPSRRTTRIERRLRLATTDIDESVTAQKLHGLRPPSGRTSVQRHNQVSVLARRAGVAGRVKWHGYAEVIRDAAADAHMDPAVLELVWRLGSGLAHGRSWASIGLLEREHHSDPDDPVQQVAMSAPLDQLNLFAMTALSLTTVARATFERRRVKSAG